MGTNNYSTSSLMPPGLDLESLHVTSEKDPWYPWSNEYLVFDHPELILHGQGHKPPKYLQVSLDEKDSDLTVFHSFFMRQYTQRKYKMWEVPLHSPLIKNL
jgi:hypothetical protein